MYIIKVQGYFKPTHTMSLRTSSYCAIPAIAVLILRHLGYASL